MLVSALAGLFALIWVGTALAERYVVQNGDTLYDIGLQYGVEPEDIARANGIADASALQVGRQIDIPESSGPARTAGSVYTVVMGDTFGGIADKLGVSESALAAANGIGDTSYIYAGQKLNVPTGGSTFVATASASAAPGTHVVTDGDTLSGIADMYDTTASAIASVNGITNPNSLRVGQSLVVPERPQLSGRGGQRLAFVWPAFGEITGYFHEEGPYWVKGYHEGLDIGSGFGNVVRAAEAGVVIEAGGGWNKGYGTYVKIDHGNGLHTLYGHMSSLEVDPWQEVKRGQVIGYVGSTGASTGPHLHFEVRVDGEKTDPLQYLP
jgi:murein DD-endopeptidase MepM/ murein hydrolase activator NlpD